MSTDNLQKYFRSLSEGEFLFKKGDSGNTMFIVTHGSLEILDFNDRGESFSIGIIKAGEVLGEKALLTNQPYPRAFSAMAKTESQILEFERKDLKKVEAIIPNFSLKLLMLAAQRLDRTNQLLAILRSLDPHERFIQVFQFLAEEKGEPTPHGLMADVSAKEIDQISSLGTGFIQENLDLLERKQLILRKKEGYLIPNLESLEQYLPELREILAA